MTPHVPFRSIMARSLITLSVLALVASGRPADASAQDARAEIVAAVHAFHAALAAGDSTAALSHLADDVVILEGGGVESKDHYRSGHLAGDMGFAQAVPAERGEMEVRQAGDVAWAWSTSVRQGRMGEREVNSQGAELVVLRRVEDRWLITAIHWSSRPRR